MERRQLEYFVAVVDEGGFGKAAESVHVSQPSLSQAIGALEKDLGAILFHRLGRSVTLTDAGETMLPLARQILRDHAVARAAVAKVRGVYDGTLDIATTPTLAIHPLTPILSRFRDRYPGILMRIIDCDIPGGPPVVLGGGQCELGLLRLPVRGSGLITTPLARERFQLVLPPQHPDPGPGPVDLAMLGELPLIATPAGTPSRIALDEALSLGDATAPRIVVETIYRATIPTLVAAGVGAAFLPRAIAAETRRLGTRTVDTTPSISREIGIVRRDGPMSPAAQAFVDLVLEMVPELGMEAIADVGGRMGG